MRITVLQQNANGNEPDFSASDFEKLLNRLKKDDPDLLFFSEFRYRDMLATAKKALAGYRCVLPIEAQKDRDNGARSFMRAKAACALFIKESAVTDISVTELSGMLAYRYICAEIRAYDRTKLKLLLLYVPQTYQNNRTSSKSVMLRKSALYISRNRYEPLFAGGDMNSDINRANTSCIEEFAGMYSLLRDTEPLGQPTWYGQRLDYALITNVPGLSAETSVKDTGVSHKALYTVLRTED